MVHGHRDLIFGQFAMLADRAKSFDCDIVCFGHTHIPFNQTIKGVRVLNPGSIWRNRDGSKPSYMIVTLDGPEIRVEKCIYQKKKTCILKRVLVYYSCCRRSSVG